MRQLLVINPNTSDSVSRLLLTHAQAAAGPGVRVRVQTAEVGAAYIACEASYAVAGYAALAAWAQAAQANADAPFDAVLIGCFGDPGLFALRESCPTPITGLAEASFIQAAAHGRFVVVTGGAKWAPILERLAQNLGVGNSLAGIATVEPSGAQLAQDPIAAHALLALACQRAVRQHGAQAVVLGGAGLAGMAVAIQPLVNVPVIDSVVAGVQHALNLAPRVPIGTPGFGFAWHNVLPALAALGQHS